MPYYLLLVASPEAISYEFQYQIDVQYGVGRLHFETAEEYAYYAASVVAAERGEVVLPRRATYFGVQNPNDKSTLLSNKYLLGPLAEWTKTEEPQWNVDVVEAEAATRARLTSVLGGGETPAFLFTASHGMGLPSAHKAQARLSGALCCQDWPGPGTTGKTRDYYFAGEDLASDARVGGMIAMMYACFGLGTPDKDDFAQGEKAMFAPRPLVSDLPRKLLAHPKGGALAVIGHVDLAWDYSFRFKGSTPHRQVFESTTKRLLEGHPVGSAMEYFNSRYAELSSDLTPILQKAEAGKSFSEADLRVFLARNDARNYAVFGDPAVRLPVGDVTTPKREAPVVATLTERTMEPEQVSFGFRESISAAGDGLEESVKNLAARMGQTLERAVESVLTLEVATYVADDLALVTYEKGTIAGARLRALSLISLDGGTKVVLPEKDGKVDTEVWAIHQQAMERALANRNEMVKLAAAAITGLLGGVKK